jgi:hypothetical protein
MGTLKVIIKAIKERDIFILKEKLEEDYGVVWFEGPFPNKEGGFRAYVTFEIKEENSNERKH